MTSSCILPEAVKFFHMTLKLTVISYVCLNISAIVSVGTTDYGEREREKVNQFKSLIRLGFFFFVQPMATVPVLLLVHLPYLAWMSSFSLVVGILAYPLYDAILTLLGMRSLFTSLNGIIGGEGVMLSSGELFMKHKLPFLLNIEILYHCMVVVHRCT